MPWHEEVWERTSNLLKGKRIQKVGMERIIYYVNHSYKLLAFQATVFLKLVPN